MAKEIPTTEPTHFVAGMTWEWDKCFADYPPSDGWELTYYFRSHVDSGNDLTAAWATEVTANGETFEVRIAHANTGLTPGAWDLVGEINNATTGKKHPVINDRIKVVADPSTPGVKSHARTMLDALDALDVARAAGSDKLVIQVNGRRVEYATGEAVNLDRARWMRIVQLENRLHARLRHVPRMVNA